jgi:vancomycin permeability regulator SanA
MSLKSINQIGFNLSNNYNIIIYSKTLKKKEFLRHNHILKKLIIVTASIIILNILSVIVYWNLSVSYSNNDLNSQFDCGIVFFHSVTKQGALSIDTKERCNLAVALFKNGTIKNVICAGGSTSNAQGPRMMYEYIRNAGVPDSIIFSDSASYSSKTNIIEADKIISQKKFNSALLISSPTHIQRLKYLSGDYLKNVKPDFITFKYNYSITDIYLDCNSEFIKWIYLLFLPDSFTDFSKKLIQ